MLSLKSKHVLGIGILALVLASCVASTPTPDPLPEHTVHDYWDNGKATNFAYFLVADKALSETEAYMIIQHYQEKHSDFLLINIWIFCDTMYAEQKYLDDLSVTDDQFFSHVLYWYQTGDWSSEGTLFQTQADEAYPTFRSACQ